jgi:hypothetical protein
MGALCQDEFRSGTLGAANDVVELSQPGTATVMVQLIVTGTNTTVFEVNVNQGDSPTWVATSAQNVNTGAIVTSATASGIFRVDISGAREFRVRCSSYSSGSAVVSMNGSVATASSSTTAGSGGSVVDTELPAAAALADATANPTAPAVGAFAHVWNGTTWDRLAEPSSSGASGTNLGIANVAHHFYGGGTSYAVARGATIIGDANAGAAFASQGNMAFNAVTWDRVRNNLEGTVLASAARTSAPGAVTLTNFNGRAVYIIVDVTAIVASPSITVTIAGVDVVSGVAYTLLTGAALTGVGTTVYKVGAGLPNTANVSSNDYVPRTFRISVSHLDGDSITYSIGYALMMT